MSFTYASTDSSEIDVHSIHNTYFLRNTTIFNSFVIYIYIYVVCFSLVGDETEKAFTLLQACLTFISILSPLGIVTVNII